MDYGFVMMKPSSGMCSLLCDYCFYRDETEKRQHASFGFMTEQTLKNIIRKTILKVDKQIVYAYQGGEPTLRGIDFFKKVLEYQKHYNKNGVVVQNIIQTNGYLLDEEWCRFFHDNQFLVGVSLDGVRETHNLYRHTKDGHGTFDRIMLNIELLKKYNVEYNILTVVNKDVAVHIKEIYNFYRKNHFYWQQYILCLDPLGEVHGNTKYSLTSKMYGDFLIILFNLWYKDWLSGNQISIRKFENYIGILMGIRPEVCDQCGQCSIHTVVEADGSVYPCDFYMLDEYCIGNFNRDSFTQIYENGLNLKFVQQSLMISDKCKKCKYYYLCRCGCHRNRDFDNNTGTWTNYYCEGYYRFFDSCIEQMKQMVKMINKT